jgi:hypothetical protein
MSATDYADLSRHIGHKVEVVTYAEVNVAIECEDCSEVLLDYDKEEQINLLTDIGLRTEEMVGLYTDLDKKKEN